jgi:restriction endonuclease S subunit
MSRNTDQWQRFRFDEMATLVNDRVDNPSKAHVDRYVGLAHLDTGSLKIRRWGETSEVESTKLLFKAGDIIFGKRRVYQRKLAVADFDGICSAHAMVLRAKSKVVLPEFLPFLMQSDMFMGRALEISVGSLSPTINWRALAKEEFALPPLEEQRRIAEVLMATHRAMDSTTEAHVAMRLVYESLAESMAALMSKQFPATTLRNVADIRYGLTVNQTRRKALTLAPYLRVANVQRKSLDLSVVKRIGVLPGDDKYRLQAGDILIVEGHANSHEIGRACVWTDAVPDMMHQNHLIRVRCGDRINPDYLCMLINSPHGRSFFQARAKSSSGLNTINSTVVKNYQLPLPPQTVQDKVLAEFRNLSDAERLLLSRHQRLTDISHQLHASVGESPL